MRSAGERNTRADRGRSIRYRASRIFRGENPREFLSNQDTARLVQRLVHETYAGEQAPTYELADDTGQSKKAAENWWAGENPMGLTAFVNAYRNNPRFAAFARFYLLGHTENDPILEIQVQTTLANLGAAARSLGMPTQQLAAAMTYAMGNTIAAPDSFADASIGDDCGGREKAAADLFDGVT